MFTILDYSSALEYSIIRRYTNIVYYYYYAPHAIMKLGRESIHRIRRYHTYMFRQSKHPYRSLSKACLVGQVYSGQHLHKSVSTLLVYTIHALGTARLGPNFQLSSTNKLFDIYLASFKQSRGLRVFNRFNRSL